MKRFAILWLLFQICSVAFAQEVVERPYPEEWKQLIPGTRFVDRFLPMPDGRQEMGIWGADSVLCRYVDNGIELPDVSFWGGKHFEVIRREVSFVRMRMGGKFSQGTWDMVGFHRLSCGM